MIVVIAVMAVITTITLSLRVYVRMRLVRRSWEDWAAGIGWFVYIFCCGVSIVGPFYGTGQYTDLLPPESRALALRVRTSILLDPG